MTPPPPRPTPARPTAALLTAALLTAGCGEPLRSADYPGEPLAVFVGALTAFGPQPAPPSETLRVAIIWSVGDEVFIDQPGPDRRVVPGAEVRIVLHAPPPAAAREAGYAMGRIIAYDDVDDDGQRGPDEPIYGGPIAPTLFWSPSGLGPDDAPLTLPIAAGYVLVHGWLPCDGPYAVADDPACDPAPLGAKCDGDRACGPGGRCVTDAGPIREAGGACVLADTPGGTCPPAGARRVPFNDAEAGLVWVWGLACTERADCPHQRPCGAGTGTCLSPLGAVPLFSDQPIDTPRVCRDHQTRYPPSAGSPHPDMPPPARR